MSARVKPQTDWRSDPRLLQVAAETGYPVDQVCTRGVDFCRRNPRSKAGDFQFDQTIPDFEPVRRVDLEDADGPADFLSQTRLPGGMIDMQRDAELVPKGRTVEGIARYILAEGTQTARVANGEAIPIRLERVPVRGGVSVRGRIGARIVFEVPALSEAEADMRERMHTAMLYAAAHDAAEIIKTEPNYFQRA